MSATLSKRYADLLTQQIRNEESARSRLIELAGIFVSLGKRAAFPKDGAHRGTEESTGETQQNTEDAAILQELVSGLSPEVAQGDAVCKAERSLLNYAARFVGMLARFGVQHVLAESRTFAVAVIDYSTRVFPEYPLEACTMLLTVVDLTVGGNQGQGNYNYVQERLGLFPLHSVVFGAITSANLLAVVRDYLLHCAALTEQCATLNASANSADKDKSEDKNDKVKDGKFGIAYDCVILQKILLLTTVLVDAAERMDPAVATGAAASAVDFAKFVLSHASAYLTQMPDVRVRLEAKGDIDNALSAFEALAHAILISKLRPLSPAESAAAIHLSALVSMRCAIRLLSNKANLSQRWNGLRDLNALCMGACNTTRYMVRRPEDLSAQQIADELMNANIMKILFGEGSVHVQLIRQCRPLISLLIQQQRFDVHQLRQVWSAAEGMYAADAAEALDLLRRSISLSVTPDVLALLCTLLSEVPAASITQSHLNLAFRAADLLASIDAAHSNQHLGIDLLWKFAFPETPPAGPPSSVMSEALMKLIYLMEKLRNTILTIKCIMRAVELLSTGRQLAGAAKFILSALGVGDDAFHHRATAANAVSQALAADVEETKKLLQLVLSIVPQCSGGEDVVKLLQLVKALLDLTPLILDSEQLVSLWNATVLNGPPEARNAMLSAIAFVAPQKVDQLDEFYVKTFDPWVEGCVESLPIAALQVQQALFRYVNQDFLTVADTELADGVDPVKPKVITICRKPGGAPSPFRTTAIKEDSPIKGENVFWSIALNCTDDFLAEAAASDLLWLTHNASSAQTLQFRGGRRRRFVERVLNRLSSPSLTPLEACRSIELLRQLLFFFEASLPASLRAFVRRHGNLCPSRQIVLRVSGGNPIMANGLIHCTDKTTIAALRYTFVMSVVGKPYHCRIVCNNIDMPHDLNFLSDVPNMRSNMAVMFVASVHQKNRQYISDDGLLVPITQETYENLGPSTAAAAHGLPPALLCNETSLGVIFSLLDRFPTDSRVLSAVLHILQLLPTSPIQIAASKTLCIDCSDEAFDAVLAVRHHPLRILYALQTLSIVLRGLEDECVNLVSLLPKFYNVDDAIEEDLLGSLAAVASVFALNGGCVRLVRLFIAAVAKMREDLSLRELWLSVCVCINDMLLLFAKLRPAEPELSFATLLQGVPPLETVSALLSLLGASADAVAGSPSETQDTDAALPDSFEHPARLLRCLSELHSSFVEAFLQPEILTCWVEQLVLQSSSVAVRNYFAHFLQDLANGSTVGAADSICNVMLRLLDSAKRNDVRSRQFFALLSRLLPVSSLPKRCGADLLHTMLNVVSTHSSAENTFKPDTADHVLAGLLAIAGNIAAHLPSESLKTIAHSKASSRVNSVSRPILSVLLEDFLLAVAPPGDSDPVAGPICKHAETRIPLLRLVSVLTSSTDALQSVSASCYKAFRAFSRHMPPPFMYCPSNSRRSPSGAVGLRNLGATCYMNSLLQQLFYVPAFRARFLSLRIAALKRDESATSDAANMDSGSSMSTDRRRLSPPAKAPKVSRLSQLGNASSPGLHDSGVHDSMMPSEDGASEDLDVENDFPALTGNAALATELQSVFAHLQESEFLDVDTTKLCKECPTIDGTPFNPHHQMDAEEFLGSLFDRMEDLFRGTGDQHVIRDFFGGRYVYSTCGKSNSCNHVSFRYQNFFVLPVDVKGMSNLEESLRALISGETIDGDNKYFCEKCDAHVDAVRRMSVAHLPEHLIIHLKRFEFDLTSLRRCKVHTEFAFPVRLNMKPYTIESIDLALDESRASDDTDAAMNTSIDAADSGRPVFHEHGPAYYEYVLGGILIHMGYADAGHYFSYCRLRECAPPEQSSPFFVSNELFDLAVHEVDPPSEPPTDEDGIARQNRICDSVKRLGALWEHVSPEHIEAAYQWIMENNNKWMHLNDSVVEPFDPANIGSASFGGVFPEERANTRDVPKPKTFSAYILFYDRLIPGPRPERLSMDPTSSVVAPALSRSIWRQNQALRWQIIFFDRAFAKFMLDLFLAWSPGTSVENEYAAYQTPVGEKDCQLLSLLMPPVAGATSLITCPPKPIPPPDIVVRLAVSYYFDVVIRAAFIQDAIATSPNTMIAGDVSTRNAVVPAEAFVAVALKLIAGASRAVLIPLLRRLGETTLLSEDLRDTNITQSGTPPKPTCWLAIGLLCAPVSSARAGSHAIIIAIVQRALELLAVGPFDPSWSSVYEICDQRTPAAGVPDFVLMKLVLDLVGATIACVPEHVVWSWRQIDSYGKFMLDLLALGHPLRVIAITRFKFTERMLRLTGLIVDSESGSVVPLTHYILRDKASGADLLEIGAAYAQCIQSFVTRPVLPVLEGGVMPPTLSFNGTAPSLAVDAADVPELMARNVFPVLPDFDDGVLCAVPSADALLVRLLSPEFASTRSLSLPPSPYAIAKSTGPDSPQLALLILHLSFCVPARISMFVPAILQQLSSAVVDAPLLVSIFVRLAISSQSVLTSHEPLDVLFRAVEEAVAGNSKSRDALLYLLSEMFLRTPDVASRLNLSHMVRKLYDWLISGHAVMRDGVLRCVQCAFPALLAEFCNSVSRADEELLLYHDPPADVLSSERSIALPFLTAMSEILFEKDDAGNYAAQNDIHKNLDAIRMLLPRVGTNQTINDGVVSGPLLVMDWLGACCGLAHYRPLLLPHVHFLQDMYRETCAVPNKIDYDRYALIRALEVTVVGAPRILASVLIKDKDDEKDRDNTLMECVHSSFFYRSSETDQFVKQMGPCVMRIYAELLRYSLVEDRNTSMKLHHLTHWFFSQFVFIDYSSDMNYTIPTLAERVAKREYHSIFLDEVFTRWARDPRPHLLAFRRMLYYEAIQMDSFYSTHVASNYRSYLETSQTHYCPPNNSFLRSPPNIRPDWIALVITAILSSPDSAGIILNEIHAPDYPLALQVHVPAEEGPLQTSKYNEKMMQSRGGTPFRRALMTLCVDLHDTLGGLAMALSNRDKLAELLRTRVRLLISMMGTIVCSLYRAYCRYFVKGLPGEDHSLDLKHYFVGTRLHLPGHRFPVQCTYSQAFSAFLHAVIASPASMGSPDVADERLSGNRWSLQVLSALDVLAQGPSLQHFYTLLFHLDARCDDFLEEFLKIATEVPSACVARHALPKPTQVAIYRYVSSFIYALERALSEDWGDSIASFCKYEIVPVARICFYMAGVFGVLSGDTGVLHAWCRLNVRMVTLWQYFLESCRQAPRVPFSLRRPAPPFCSTFLLESKPEEIEHGIVQGIMHCAAFRPQCLALPSVDSQFSVDFWTFIEIACPVVTRPQAGFASLVKFAGDLFASHRNEVLETLLSRIRQCRGDGTEVSLYDEILSQ